MRQLLSFPLCETCSGGGSRVQEYKRRSAATVRSSPKLNEGSRSIIAIVVLDVACSLICSVYMHSTRAQHVKPHRGQFLNSTDKHEDKAYEGSEPLRILKVSWLELAWTYFPNACRRFSKLTPTGLMGSPQTTVIYEVFSILVWVGLVLGTETRKKQAPSKSIWNSHWRPFRETPCQHGKNAKSH